MELFAAPMRVYLHMFCLSNELNMHTQILYEGAKELAQVEPDSSKYVLSPDNQVCTLFLRNYS